jgi:alkylhydroperoxidase family enzyme
VAWCLRRFAAAVVKSRGWPAPADTAEFLRASYGYRQVLEVLLDIDMKTLSNYANHIAKTPLDQAFASAAWSKAA